MANKIVILAVLAMLVLISILCGIAVTTYFYLTNIEVNDVNNF
jgi:hypothetical protein